MKKRHFTLPLVGLCAFFSLTLCGCNIRIGQQHKDLSESLDEQGNLVVPMDIALGQDRPEGYQEGVVLVKTYEFAESSLASLSYKKYYRLAPNSPWYKIELSRDQDTVSAVEYLRELGNFETVDYDYIMATEADIDTVDVSSNPMSSDLPYIESQGIGWAWGHLKKQGKNPGGSNDVIVAVIDTGVDYNHIDLRNNIWTNPGEIPNNGIDDDGNGYVDDIRGWNCVGDNNNPMDDNGHGTHVSGIIAAENNDIGTVGVASNCKIMALKAGNSTGAFQNSDIVEAIEYAYMNGASVINMSFGGFSYSQATGEALTDAYSQCVLVAAAGNSSICNQPNCPDHWPNCAPSYPGALPYVLGVMSCDATGAYHSSFSNSDHWPYNEYEYEAYACGEQIPSTWPNNKYAYLSGTSMAAPVVSGIAALLRSAYPDRNTYSNKYIHSQICNTGDTHPIVFDGEFGYPDTFHAVANIEDAFTKIPTPYIYGVYRFFTVDNPSLSPKNNGDGIVDAGETVKLGVDLMNRGGKAKNVHVAFDTIRNNDPDLTDPYITFLQSEFDMDDIGTYSIGEGGKHYENGKLVDIDHAALVHIADDTPNDYIAQINATITYKNGLDNDDHNQYQGRTAFALQTSAMTRLPSVINEDTVFTADKMYSLVEDMIVSAGATVTFEEGCKIQVFDHSSAEIDTIKDSPRIVSYGTLNFQGSEEHRINIDVLDVEGPVLFTADGKNGGVINFSYCDIRNLGSEEYQTNLNFDHCTITSDSLSSLESGQRSSTTPSLYTAGSIANCVIKTEHPIRTHGAFSGNVLKMGKFGFQPTLNEMLATDESIIRDNVFMDIAEEPMDTYHQFYYYNDVRVKGKSFENNAFLREQPVTSLSKIIGFEMGLDEDAETSGNIARDEYKIYSSQLLRDNVDTSGNLKVDVTDEANHDASKVWPFIENIELLDKHNNPIDAISRREQGKVRVTFSTELDTTKPFALNYGSVYPYSDYEIKGDFVSSTVWEGEFEVTALIEGGIQRFRATGGCKADDSFKEVLNNAAMFSFTIESTSAMSMDMQANSQEDGVHLSWVQDDYDTLMGYNIYRSESKDGNFVRINPTIIPAGENEFLDDNAEPGKTYWYTFTVVFSDLSESIPAGKVSATCLDTIAPSIYHTPVNQGYLGNNLIISCTASDNVNIISATLYYRVKGQVQWQSLTMAKQNNRYSAAIFGDELSSEGMEYYIEVSDGRNLTLKGSPEAPYSITIKDSSALSTLGDVDGDGIITTRDALMIVRAINGDLILTDDQFQRADLNKDGELSSVEALRILQYVNGKISTVEM